MRLSLGPPLALVAILSCPAAPAQQQQRATTAWLGSWAASQQVPEPHNSLSPEDVRDATLRQLVHLSVGGASLRVHVSNAFGREPLRLVSVHIARPVSTSEAKVDPATDKALTFAGKNEVTVPAGAEFISDPIDYPAPALGDLAISMHFDGAPAGGTGHPGSRTTSYLVHGDRVSAADLPDAKRIDHWYNIAGVDVAAPVGAAAIVILGDSITDGRGSTTNGNNRWTDVLARRLQNDASFRSVSVLNHGIGGNHLLTDGLGPNALARFDRDVLAQAGVRYLIVLEGINDVGKLARAAEASAEEHAALVRNVVSAYEQIVTRARTHGIRAIGGTLMPFTGSEYYHPSPAIEADRQAINDWIRAPGHFDGVIDFDRITRDPEHPERLLPAFDSGDRLHPSPAGYAAMADGVPLALFAAR